MLEGDLENLRAARRQCAPSRGKREVRGQTGHRRGNERLSRMSSTRDDSNASPLSLHHPRGQVHEEQIISWKITGVPSKR